MIGFVGTAAHLSLGACNLGEITTTSTVTLDGREVIVSIVRSAVITPIDEFITGRINAFFDELEDE